MKIKLDQIHPSPNPVRKTWDEEKMQELAQSIKERGVIVPIKVRPNSTGYEIVYGHRRVEAARRAGMDEIPAIVENVDNTDTLIQALIENIVREDMYPVEEAEAIKKLTQLTKWTPNMVANKLGVPHRRIHYLMALLDETDKTKRLLGKHIGGGKVKSLHAVQTPITETHVRSVVEAGVKNPRERERLLVKASDEELTYRDTRQLADAYIAAPTPEIKERIIKEPFPKASKETISRRAEILEDYQPPAETFEQQQRRKAIEEYDSAAADFFRAIRSFNSMVDSMRSMKEKLSPEGKQSAIRRINRLITTLEELRGDLA